MEVRDDATNQKPLFYENYPGSIVDVSQLQYMLEKAKGYGYKNIGFILDRGYFSKDNIHYMDDCGYDFVIMVKGKASFIEGLITKQKGQFETNRAHVIREYQTYGMTIKERLYTDDKQKRYFHLYQKTSKENAERTQLEVKLEKMTEMMNRHKGKEVEFGKQYEHYF